MSTLLICALIGLLAGTAVLLAEPGTHRRLERLTRPGTEDPDSSSDAGADGSYGAGAADGDARRAAKSTGPRRSSRSGRQVGQESPADQLAFDLELVAICLQSGLPTERALILAARAAGDRSGLGRLGHAMALGEVETAGDSLREVVSLIGFSRRTGVALAPLLRGLASDMRRAEHRRRQLAAARLGVTLVIPLGVCILPAFILMGIVPVVITLVSDMAGVFG